jgi:prevent-host-death family protein
VGRPIQIPIHQAKTHLSRLIERACAGEEVIIAKGDVPMVRLVPVQQPAARRVFGSMRGQITIDEAFFEPMSEEELREWEGL